MNSQTDKSLDDFDQTLEHSKQQPAVHNEVNMEVRGSWNAMSGTGDVNVNIIQKKTKDYKELIADSQKPYFFLFFLFSVRLFLFFQGKSNDILSGGVKEIILISVTFILGGLWLISADHELSILENHLGKWLPRYKFPPRVISYSIPSFIMILSATTNYIHEPISKKTKQND